MPQSMGFPATDRGGSLEAQRYYGGKVARYWIFIQFGLMGRVLAPCRKGRQDRHKRPKARGA